MDVSEGGRDLELDMRCYAGSNCRTQTVSHDWHRYGFAGDPLFGDETTLIFLWHIFLGVANWQIWKARCLPCIIQQEPTTIRQLQEQMWYYVKLYIRAEWKKQQLHVTSSHTTINPIKSKWARDFGNNLSIVCIIRDRLEVASPLPKVP